MARKQIVIVPLATALASLAGVAGTTENANAALPHDGEAALAPDSARSSNLKANAFFSAGEDLLSFVMTEREDGTLVAQHVSHASHASHRSHASHYSSR